MLLHFGAVDQSCTVWVNGIESGSHTGGYLPFTLDVTDQLRGPGDQLIEVRVRDLSETGVHARGKQRLDRGTIWYTAQSGIWQTVWLEPVPAAYVERLVVVPHLDIGALEVTVVAAGVRSSETATVVVSTKLDRRRPGHDPSRGVGAGPALRGAAVVPRRPAPLRPRGDPRRGPGDLLRRAALVRGGRGRGGPAPVPAQRRAGRARGRPRPGLLARRAAHTTERRGDGPRHRVDEGARLHDAAQARQGGAAAVVRPLRPAGDAGVAGRGQRRWPLPAPRDHPPRHPEVAHPRPAAPALRAPGPRRQGGVPAGGCARPWSCWPTWSRWPSGLRSTRAGDSSTPTRSPARSPRSTRPARSTTSAAGSTREAATSAASTATCARSGCRDAHAVAVADVSSRSRSTAATACGSRATTGAPASTATGTSRTPTSSTRPSRRCTSRSSWRRSDGLGATVYTQLSDVEDELNGLVTWDREVLKLDADVVQRVTAALRSAIMG